MEKEIIRESPEMHKVVNTIIKKINENETSDVEIFTTLENGKEKLNLSIVESDNHE